MDLYVVGHGPAYRGVGSGSLEDPKQGRFESLLAPLRSHVEECEVLSTGRG